MLFCKVTPYIDPVSYQVIFQEEISRVNKEAESLQRPVQGDGLSAEEAAAQLVMWRSLMKIFQLKLETAQAGNQNGQRDRLRLEVFFSTLKSLKLFFYILKTILKTINRKMCIQLKIHELGFLYDTYLGLFNTTVLKAMRYDW